MALVKFSRKEFEKNIKITPQIQEKIAMFGTPVESVNDNEIAIEIFPNRPDMLSLQGYLRAFLAFIGKRKISGYAINKPEKDYEIFIDRSVHDVRPFTACAIVKNLKFDSEKIREIMDVQEKIHATLGRNRKKIAIGIYPLEKIKLPIKYEARKPQDIKFIPLDASREMNANEILKEHPTGREYGHLLANFKKFPVFVDASNEILSMPPIINSQKTGKITEQTKDVFIECSGFSLEVLKKTLNILVTMLADIGGEIYQMKLNYKKPEITPNLEPEKIKISIEAANKLLGLQLKEKNVKELLEKMGFAYESASSEVIVPAWRTDILHEVDIIEDIAIAYGYDKFEAEIPEISTIGKENRKERMKRKIAEILAGLGFLEVSSYHLLVKDELKKAEQKNLIEVEKSRTEYCVLRPNLLYSVLGIFGESTDAEYPQKIFETGEVFEKDDKEEAGIKETEKLCIAITPGNFTEIKQVLDYLFKAVGLEYKLEETISSNSANYIEGRTAKIILGKEIGIIGEIHPGALCNWHLKMPASCMEIDLGELTEKF